MTRRSYLVAMSLALVACADMSPPVRAYTWDYSIPGSGGLVFRWPASSLPVRIWVQESSDLPNDVAVAIAEWERNAPYGEFHAVIVADSTKADIIVQQGTTRAPVTDATGASAFPNRACEALTSYYPHLNDSMIDLPFRTVISAHTGFGPDEQRQCFAVVAVHTLGSTLGILTNSDDSADVMYGLPTHTTLSPRDQATFLKLYHTQPTMRLPASR